MASIRQKWDCKISSVSVQGKLVEKPVGPKALTEV